MWVRFPVDATTGYVVGNAGIILKTTDGGATWVAQTSGSTEELRSISFPVDATTGYIAGKKGTILKTTDGGSNWVSQDSGTNTNLRGVSFPADATTGYVVGNNGKILKTTDGGSNWASQTSGTSNMLFGVDFPTDATTGYAVGSDPTVLRTTNGGTNWNSQTIGGTDGLRAVHFPTDANTGYAVGQNGFTVTTTDGGSNWISQTPGTSEELRAVWFPGATYYVRKTGSDTNDGLTPATAWLTIDHAADTMKPGNVVYVGAGTYSEQVTPTLDGTAGSPIRFIADTDGAKTGDAGAVLVTQSTGQALWATSDDYLEFDGFRFTGGSTFGVRLDTSTGIVLRNCEMDGASSHGIYVGDSDVTIDSCDLHDNGLRGIDFGGNSTATVTETLFHNNAEGVKDYATGTPATATFRRCRFYNNTANGAALYYGDFTFINCVFYGNAGKGLATSTGSPTVTAWHCTIDNNGDEGIKQSSGTVTVRNCIITNNGFQGLALYAGTMDHTYNLLWGNSAPYAGTTAGTGEILADPLFESATDYHLQTGSPATR